MMISAGSASSNGATMPLVAPPAPRIRNLRTLQLQLMIHLQIAHQANAVGVVAKYFAILENECVNGARVTCTITHVSDQGGLPHSCGVP